MDQSRKDVRKFLCIEEGLANPSHIHFKSPIKIQLHPQELATLHDATAMKAEKCGWGPKSPICKNIEEDWDGDHQKQSQQSIPSTQAQHPQKRNLKQLQNAQQPQMPDFQCLQPQNFQCSQSQTCDIPDSREWEEKMERLNNKYGLDFFSDSEVDSKSDEGEDYKYEHKYETLI